MKKVIELLNKVEEKFRNALRRYPVAYTFVGGVSGAVFLWGVWSIVDSIFAQFNNLNNWITGGVSITVAVVFFSVFSLIFSFVVAEKVDTENFTERSVDINSLKSKIDLLEAHVGYLDQKLAEKSDTLHNK